MSRFASQHGKHVTVEGTLGTRRFPEPAHGGFESAVLEPNVASTRMTGLAKSRDLVGLVLLTSSRQTTTAKSGATAQTDENCHLKHACCDQVFTRRLLRLFCGQSRSTRRLWRRHPRRSPVC